MDSSQASEKLIERADQCLNELQHLTDRAQRALLTHRTSKTTDLLSNVGQSAKNSSRSLQSWKKDSGQSTITDDQQFVNTTIGLFENLNDWIDIAYEALVSRLRYRKAFLIGYISSKR